MIQWILSIAGALAWLAPWVYSKYRRPKIKGKLISEFSNKGRFNNRECIMHFMALNIISMNKPFHISVVSIELAYKDSKQTYTGEIFWARFNEWSAPGNKERLRLVINPEESLPFITTLPEDVTKTVYLTFKVDKAELSEIEWVRLKFVDYSSYSQELYINFDHIIPEQMLWDDRVWKKITDNKANAADR